MRAMKRTVSVLLSLMLVLGMMTIGMSVASAAETKVTATSNIGATASADYTADSEQVTVTYKLNTAATISGVRAVITYDKAVLKLASTNTATTCFPTLNESLVANLTKTDGRLPFNASSYNGYNFAGGAVLATVVFDIIGTGNTTVDLEVKDLISITNAPSQIDTDEVVIIDDDTNDTSKYTATAEVTVSPSGVDPSVFIQDVRLSLDGKVGINFYMIQKPVGYENSTMTVNFNSDSDNNPEENCTLPYVKSDRMLSSKRNGVMCYVHTFYFYGDLMTEPVTVTFFADGQQVASVTYTIEDLAQDLIAEYQSSRPDIVTLINTMLNFGASAQVIFETNTDNLANKNISYPLQQITADTIVVPSGIMIKPDLSSMNATFTRASAEVQTGTGIRLVISANAGFNGTVSCDRGEGDGAENLPFIGTGKTRYAILDNVASDQLDTVYTFNFSNGTNYKTSVMSYIKTALAATTDADMINLYSSLYWYNQAAKAVFAD